MIQRQRFLLLWFCIVFLLSHHRHYATVSASSAAGQETLIGIVGHDFVLLGADSSVSQSIALQASNLDKIFVVVDPFPHSQEIRKAQQTIVAAAAGDFADSDRLTGLLSAQAAIREYQGSVGSDVEHISVSDATTHNGNSDCLTVEAVARLARGQIASSLRSRTPLHVCLLVAGMQAVTQDEEEEEDSFSSHLQNQVQRASRSYVRHETATNDVQEEKQQPMDKQDSSLLLKPRLYWLDSYGSLQKLHYGAHGLGANFLLSVLDQGYAKHLTREQALELMQECFRQLRLRYVINSPQPPCIKCIDKHGCHVMNVKL